MNLPEKYAQWNGIPREEIAWHPSIDSEKCTGCGMCVVSCGRQVFDYCQTQKKSRVARPFQCMVGCTSCKTWCIFNAISFPDEQIVKDFIRKKQVLAVIKKKLDQLPDLH
jgi:NAD-dependent dihydropyrimidine dehydrogenase PreA subunit